MRNAKLHGKFFALLDLAYQYFEPTGGPGCRDRSFAGSRAWPSTSKPGTESPQLTNAVLAYIKKPGSNAPSDSRQSTKAEALREFITIDAGFTLIWS